MESLKRILIAQLADMVVMNHLKIVIKRMRTISLWIKDIDACNGTEH